MGFPRSFDYTGTRDNTSWLAIPSALKFFRDLGPEAAWTYERALIAACSTQIEALGANPAGPIGMCAAMRSFVLPQHRPAQPDDRITLMQDLWDRERIQVAANVLEEKLLLRVSAQVYVDEDDMLRLASALHRIGWPGR